MEPLGSVRAKFGAVPEDAYRYTLVGLLILLVFTLSGLDGYIFLRSLTEPVGIVITTLVFIIIWNARRYLNNNYLLFLGISLAFVALLEFLHTLFYVYGGMSVPLQNIETNLSDQFWIAAQYVQAFSLVMAPFFIDREIRVNAVLGAYVAVITGILITILRWRVFPVMFVSGAGQTLFMTASEWMIIALFVVSLFLLVRRRKIFERKIFLLLASFILVSAFSEICFAVSADAFSLLSLGGYLAKTASFYLLYRAVIVISFTDPYKLILQSLKHKEDELKILLEESERRATMIAESEQKFRAVAESVNNALVTFDAAGRVVYWNKSAQRVFGYAAKEVIGKPFVIGIDRKKNDWDADPYTSVEFPGKRKNGAEFPMKVSWSSWKVGVEQFHTAVVRDVSVYREAERRLQEYAHTLEEGKALDDALLLSIADGILVTDTKGIVTYVNKALEKICGMPASEIVRRELDEAIPFFDERGQRAPSNARPIYIALDAKRKGDLPISTSSSFYLVNKKDQRKVPLSISAAPFVVGGTTLGAVVVWRDITQAKEIDRAKSEFISFASHQLRTPLTSISLATDMLLNHTREKLTADQKKYLRIAFRGIKEMRDIIETLLNISRIQMGTLLVNPEPIRLEKFTDELLKDVSLALKKRQIRVIRAYEKQLPALNVDQRLMKIVLENLVSNAMKYSPPRGAIRVEITKQPREVVIAISDTGDGVPKDQQEKIFEKLFRVQTDSKIKGTGLGLYIVKEAADRYGGRVWCESPSARAFKKPEEAGERGTTFFVTVPLSGMDASNA